MKMTFLKLFLICMFKEPNLAKQKANLAENLLKFELYGVHEVCFFKVFLRASQLNCKFSGSEKKNCQYLI